MLLGPNTSRIFYEDPKLLLFTLSRYKFVSKMLDGCDSVLEIGCQEGFGARLVQKVVRKYKGVDFYLPYIEFARTSQNSSDVDFTAHDMLDGPIMLENNTKFESCFALDVLEHISLDDENLFMTNSVRSLHPEKGQMLIGMPSLESQIYASKSSKLGHVNCKTGEELKRFMKSYFQFVYIFSLNDEVVHTGFFPMSHYLIALGVKPIRNE